LGNGVISGTEIKIHTFGYRAKIWSSRNFIAGDLAAIVPE